LIFAVLVPVFIGAAWGLFDLYHYQREGTRKSLQDLVRALSAVVDADISRREAMLRTLARSPALLTGDLAAFHRFAQQVAPSTDQTIVLTDLDGRQLVNSRLPWQSDRLPQASSTHALRARLGVDPKATLVSNLYFAPIGKKYSFAVQVPVVRDDKIIYYLAIGSYASSLQPLVVDPRLNEGWNAALFDRQGVVIARRMEPERFVGQSGVSDTIEHFKSAREGVLQTQRLDGTSAVTAFHAVGNTGWTLVVSMPLDAYQGPFLRAVGTTFAVTLTFLAVAIVGALIASRKISHPLRDLAVHGPSIAKGHPITDVHYGLHEADVIANALRKAGEEVQSVNRGLEKRVEAAVNEANRVQQQFLQNQKLEALGRLTGGIAHDFNNLLQTIITALQLIEFKSSDPVVKRAVESAQRAVGSGASLSRQLMTFGRAQPSQLETIRLADEIERMRELIVGALKRDIELITAFAADEWPVRIDKVQFELALLNICFNARDAMPGGGTVSVATFNETLAENEIRDLRAGDYVLLRVSDTGEGISPDIQDRVFEPFFTTKEVGKGSGLGLAQVYGFARQSRGAVSIHSDGKGATVSLWLPRAFHVERSKADESTPSPQVRGFRCRVLLVEDDLRIQAVLAPALQSLGFEVRAAHDAASALESLATDSDVDVVFSDIVMPGGRTGVDLAREINAKYPGLPVLLSTGYSETGEAGYTTLLKPYDIHKLASALMEHSK